MSNNQTLRQAIHFVLAASVTTAAITVSPKASAQEKPTPVEAAKLETVVVTGTRIAQPALEAVSPVMTVNTEEFKQTGTTRVEDLLNSLPQVASDLGTNQSNGATGTAHV